MRSICLLYIPVLHRGYNDFLKTLPQDTDIFLVSNEILETLDDEFDYLRRKDSLRAVAPLEMSAALKGMDFLEGRIVEVLTYPGIVLLNQQKKLSIVCPDEDVTRAVVNRYFFVATTRFIPVFLRWHRDNVAEKKSVVVHRSQNITEFDRAVMAQAQEEASKSFDWWRQVGGVLVKEDSPILCAHNTHVPDEQMPAAFGDPRSIFKRGIHLELTTADHAEAALIAEAAKRGISTEGAWLYVTTFPCPTCAMLVARSGISKVFFSGGYAVLDGEKNLKYAGVELVYIENL
ncbi:MAG: deaminase [Candidatus Paceibacterota bacterium]